ncbi:MAG: hypothetical protein JSW08_00035 [archaeon]|nr:MAG: hypothetical protein JSW08_00035 [archaeon]
MTEEEKKKVKEKYSLGKVITGTAPAILKDGKAITEQEVLIELLNKLDKIEKAVA